MTCKMKLQGASGHLLAEEVSALSLDHHLCLRKAQAFSAAASLSASADFTLERCGPNLMTRYFSNNFSISSRESPLVSTT